jgi:hypothetical protein
MAIGDGTPPVKFTDENGNFLPDQEQKENGVPGFRTLFWPAMIHYDSVK